MDRSDSYLNDVQALRSQDSGWRGQGEWSQGTQFAWVVHRAMNALVLQDVQASATTVGQALQSEGFLVETCGTGTEALRLAENADRDLIVLDWVETEIDGPAVCRELRRRGSASAILMLTAAGEVRHRVSGLEAGADDYLVKPYDASELVARVRALMRRRSSHSHIRCGPIEIDLLRRQVFASGRQLSLTPVEFAVLLRLAQRPGATITSDELQSSIWQSTYHTFTNVVQVHVSRLRKKLEGDAGIIQTVRGVGYRMRVRDAAP